MPELRGGWQTGFVRAPWLSSGSEPRERVLGQQQQAPVAGGWGAPSRGEAAGLAVLMLLRRGLVCPTNRFRLRLQQNSFEAEFSGFLTLPYSSPAQILTEGCQGGCPGTEHTVAVPRPPEHLQKGKL